MSADLDAATVRARLDSLAKPPGSLGRLESLAERICLLQQTLSPRVDRRRLVVFAADHGAVAEGVGAWPSSVTGLIVQAIRNGKAACAVLAESTRTGLRVVDVGTVSDGADFEEDEHSAVPYRAARVRKGTRNLAQESALAIDEFRDAWRVGEDEARRAVRDEMTVVAGGEVGIGNTTAASCLAALLGKIPVERAVGRGAGADDAALARKRKVVQSTVSRIRPVMETHPDVAIAAVCGLEIAALAGFFATAAQAGLVVVLDGFVATAAGMVAERLSPGTKAAFVAAHCSAEPGHAPLLRALELEPLLDGWGMRLGEGTGALLAMPLLDSAVAMVSRMATLADVGAAS